VPIGDAGVVVHDRCAVVLPPVSDGPARCSGRRRAPARYGKADAATKPELDFMFAHVAKAVSAWTRGVPRSSTAYGPEILTATVAAAYPAERLGISGAEPSSTSLPPWPAAPTAGFRAAL
jgi:hypothetical protein